MSNIPSMSLGDIDFDKIKARIDADVEAGRLKRLSEIEWNAQTLLSPEDIEAHTGETPARFNFLSLPAWLAVAKMSNVDFIPATEIASLASDDFADLVNGDENEKAFAFLDKGSEIKEGEMMRFEQCAPGSIKADLSEGKGLASGVVPHHETGKPLLDAFDCRIFETFMSLGQSHLRAYSRPLIEAIKHTDVWNKYDNTEVAGDWPVEFRVFIREGEVTGVSNYYPQMTLPDTFIQNARDAANCAKQMVAWMNENHIGVGNGHMCADTGADEPEKRANWVPETWGSQDFTLDFIISKETGKPVFLEAGPGGFRAAAPCCFESGPLGKDNMLTGIKMGLETDVIDL